MLDLLKQLAGSRAGLTTLLAGGAALIGTGVVDHASPEGQAAGVAGVGLAATGLAVLLPKLLAWVRGKAGQGPPAGPAA
jgi:hypothetical protein